MQKGGFPMALASNQDLPLGVVMERAVRWGVPASPLFAAMLTALSTTPASLSEVDAGISYIACMLGALLGFLLVCTARTWAPMARTIACWGGAVVLEVAWVALTIAEFNALPVVTRCGMVLVGLSTAVLLCLWLSVDQWSDPRCEIGKLSVALLCAFLISALISTAPYLAYASFGLPFLTAIPLALRLKERLVEPSEGSVAQQALSMVRPRLAIVPLVLAFGAGIGVLGFGGTIADYGAALAALALLVPFALGPSAHVATGQLAAPLAILGLTMAVLFESGAPFSFFLSGCAACLAWLWMDVRIEPTTGELSAASPRTTALVLGLANVFALVGLLAEHVVAGLARANTATVSVFLCALLVLVDLLWRLSALRSPATSESASRYGRTSPRTVGTAASQLGPIDEHVLETAFGLSPREAQVASLLCENRSVNYVCASLDLSRSTVKTHVRHIYEKAGVHSKDELQLLVCSDQCRKDA